MTLPKSVVVLFGFALVLSLMVTIIALTRSVSPTIVQSAPVANGTASKTAVSAVALAPRTIASNTRTLGANANAPDLVEFADFQCPYCRKFSIGAERGLEDAIKQGKLKFTYRYFPFLGQESFDAAYAAECANRQGKFWEYTDQLAIGWQGENVGSFTRDNLKKWAGQLKLDVGKFNACLDNQETKSVIDADIAEARSLNVRGTPTFFVNGKLFNAPSLDRAVDWATIWGGQ